MKIVLISCAAGKLGHPAPARDLYTSQLFRAQSAWAAANGDAWFILSAKHGLVEPGRILEPYDLALADLSVHRRTWWAQNVAHDLAMIVGKGDQVVILAGKPYRERLAELLQLNGCRVEVPMAGLGIGRQLAWLKRQADAAAGVVV